MNRRGLMKMMGLGAAAAPIAVPHIGALAMPGAELTGIAGAGSLFGDSIGEPCGPSGSRGITKHALKMLGVPSWLTSEWDRRAQHVTGFDPDIASYRFMSLPAKLALQRKRNRERVEADWWRPNPWREQEKWQEVHGYIHDD